MELEQRREAWLREVFELESEPGRVDMQGLQALLQAKLERISAAKPAAADGGSAVLHADPMALDDSAERNAGGSGAADAHSSTSELSAAAAAVCSKWGGIPGRLGPRRARMDWPRNASGSVQMRGPADLEMESHSNFTSCRANVCVYQGKWMYEVILGTGGVMQLGFCTMNCPFTNEEGVGDAPDSYAYDGKRMKKWNVSCVPYGEEWAAGDVIGICVDCDNHQISYFRNGASLGVAFSHIRSGAAYFPAVSLSYGERALINFGTFPFIYPLRPPRDASPPRPAPLRAATLDGGAPTRCRYLFRSYLRALPCLVSAGQADTPWLSAADGAAVGATVVEAAAPVMGAGPEAEGLHLVGSELLPVLLQLDACHPPAHMRALLHHLASFLEGYELSALVSSLFALLALRCRAAPVRPDPRSGPQAYLSLAIHLLRASRPVLAAWIRSPLFQPTLEGLLAMKQPSAADTPALFPTVPWPGPRRPSPPARPSTPPSSASSSTTPRPCPPPRLPASVPTPPALPRPRHALTPPHPTPTRPSRRLPDPGAAATRPTPRRRPRTARRRAPAGPGAAAAAADGSAQGALRAFVRGLVAKNRHATRNVPPPGLTDPTALASLFFALLEASQGLLSDPAAALDPRLFFDPAGTAAELAANRLGGAFGHLRKASPPPPEAAFDPAAAGALPSELMDAAVVLYHLAVGQRYKLASQLLQGHSQASAHLEEAARRAASAPPEQRPALEAAAHALEEEVVEKARACAWRRAALYSDRKKELLYSFSRLVLRTVQELGERTDALGAAYAYLPEYYVEAAIDAFHAVRRADPALPLTREPYREGLHAVVAFLVARFHADARIVNPDLRDFLLQSVSVLLQYGEFLAEFEANGTARELLVPALLEHFDFRFWIPITNVVLRIWRGVGFGSGAGARPQCPAPAFRDSLRQTWERRPELAAAFVNKLLNNINWTLTELGVAIKDVLAGAGRRGQGVAAGAEAAQQERKCAIMFELSVSALSVLEVVALEAPDAFLADRNEVSGQRIAELLVYVVNHATAGPDSQPLERVSRLGAAALEKVTRTALLRPAVGALLNLAAGGPAALARLARIVAQEPAFRPENFQHLADDVESAPAAPASAPAPRGRSPADRDRDAAQLGGGGGGGGGPDAVQPVAAARLDELRALVQALQGEHQAARSRPKRGTPSAAPLSIPRRRREGEASRRGPSAPGPPPRPCSSARAPRGSPATAGRWAAGLCAAEASPSHAEAAPAGAAGAAGAGDGMETDGGGRGDGGAAGGEEAEEEEGPVCSICYASPEDTSFEPCGHRSCHRCIQRHLLNAKRCFFCNAEITAVRDDADEDEPVLHFEL
eukprot:tig00020927_g15940.t1